MNTSSRAIILKRQDTLFKWPKTDREKLSRGGLPRVAASFLDPAVRFIIAYSSAAVQLQLRPASGPVVCAAVTNGEH